MTAREKRLQNGYYVYLLFDKRKNEVFYVGKGHGLRFLDHLKEAQKSGDASIENKKIERIRQMGDNNFGCVILRRNLLEQEAYQVEASVIDLLNSSYIKGSILNIQSGRGTLTNGIIDIQLFKSMKTKYVELFKSETLLSLNISMPEKFDTNSISQLIHKKKWNVKEEEAQKASYTVVECDNVVIAVFKSGCWKSNPDGKTCTFNGNQITSGSELNRFVSHKLPKRTKGKPQARYLNYTDIQIVKGKNDK